MVESWLMSATESNDIDNTPLWPGVHGDGRSGLVRPNQLAGHAKLKNKQPVFVLIMPSANIFIYHLYSERWLGSVR